jgi:putative membrane protein
VKASRALFGATVAAQLAYPQLPAARQTAATRAIVGLVTATSVADLVERLGGRRATLLVAASAGVGFGAEVAGVATGRIFGAYDYSDRLGPKVRGVPLLAAAAWTMMASPAWTVAGWVTRRRAARTLAAAGALTAWDLALDPRMVAEGYWSWPGGGRYEGVPASNFLGWLVVGGAIFAVWAAVDADASAPPARADVPLSLYAWTWAGEIAANLLFWKRPRVAAVAGGAMGAFAIPALRARLRARR